MLIGHAQENCWLLSSVVQEYLIKFSSIKLYQFVRFDKGVVHNRELAQKARDEISALIAVHNPSLDPLPKLATVSVAHDLLQYVTDEVQVVEALRWLRPCGVNGRITALICDLLEDIVEVREIAIYFTSWPDYDHLTIAFLYALQDNYWTSMKPFADPSPDVFFLSGAWTMALGPKQVLEILALLDLKIFGKILRKYVHSETCRSYLGHRFDVSIVSALEEIQIDKKLCEADASVGTARLCESLSAYVLSLIMQGTPLALVGVVLPRLHGVILVADKIWLRDRGSHWVQGTRPPACLLLCLLHFILQSSHEGINATLASQHHASALDALDPSTKATRAGYFIYT